MSYDIDEAVGILKGVGAELRPIETYAARVQAAEGLLNAVMEASKQAGFAVTRERGACCVTLPRSGTVHLDVADDKLVMSVDGPPPRSIPLAIAYDGARGIFVGTADDEEHIPVPGAPRKVKRNGVTVVVEAIAQAIRVQHEARKAAR
jgi:hypothetical protein